MKTEWKLALSALAAACLLTGCPYKVKEIVGTAKLVKEYSSGRTENVPVTLGTSIEDEYVGYQKRLELCEGASITLKETTFDVFNPPQPTTLTGPGIWYLGSYGWTKATGEPDCDDQDEDEKQEEEEEEDRDDNDNDRDDEQDQERSQEERQQSDSDTRDTSSNDNTSTDGSQGGNTGNGTTGAGGGAGGNTILGVSTTTFTVGGGLIAAAIIANELNDDNNDESISE